MTYTAMLGLVNCTIHEYCLVEMGLKPSYKERDWLLREHSLLHEASHHRSFHSSQLSEITFLPQ